MIPIKEAVNAALKFIQELYGEDSLTENPLEDLMLEEVELSNDESNWLITVGFNSGYLIVEDPMALLRASPVTTKRPGRVYKVIAVDAETGEPISMKIRGK